MASRLTNIEDKSLLTNPIKGLKDAEDLSLEKCLERAVARDPDFRTDFDADDSEAPVFLATMFATTKKDEHPDCPLSVDQIASIHLYTQEGPFYSLINSKLRAADRKVLVPLFPILKLLFSALDLLPRQSKTVYRGVAVDLHAQYKAKERMIWWSVTSTTGNVETLENEQFCGKSGPRTIFTIVDVPVVYIGGYSAVEIEDEYIVLPGTVLEVANVADLGSQLHMIQLKYVPSPPLVDLFRSAAQQKVEGGGNVGGGTAAGASPTAGGGQAVAGGGQTTSGGTFPKWMSDLPVNDDVRVIFVKEDIDEESFEYLEKEDFEKMGLGIGPCKRLLKEIASRKQGDGKRETEGKEPTMEKTEPSVKTPPVLQSPPPSNKEEPPTKKKTPFGLADMLRAIFVNPPKDWVDSNPVSTWSGIRVNGAGEVIEISRDIIAKHPVADWSKFPSTLQKLNVWGTECKVTDASIKLIATQCTGLQVLDVGSTGGKVTDDAIKLIATQCTGLQKLDVRSTGGKVTDDAIKLIATRCTGLRELDVSATFGSVTDDAIKLIATQCTGLQVLNVYGTGGKVTDDAIKLIATQCTGLQTLACNAGGKVTDASLKLLGAQCRVYKDY